MDPLKYFTTGVTKAVVCAILSGMVYINDPLLPIGKNSPGSGGSGFPLYLNGPLQYDRYYVTVKIMF